jgi:hypothetical protein
VTVRTASLREASIVEFPIFGCHGLDDDDGIVVGTLSIPGKALNDAAIVVSNESG